MRTERRSFHLEVRVQVPSCLVPSFTTEPELPQMAEDNMYKLMLIGNSGVGKTVLLSRYYGEEFSTDFVQTVGIDFKAKQVTR